MENLISNRLKTLAIEKQQLKKRLKLLNPHNSASYIDRVLKVNFSNGKFSNKNGEIQIAKTSNGIEVSSNLNSSEHQYLYFIDELEINDVKEFLLVGKSESFDFKVMGFSDNTINIECSLILILKNNQRVNLKVTRLGEKISFPVPAKDLIDTIKIAIRVQGHGYAYIHDPYLYSREIDSLNVQKRIRKKKEIKDLNVIFIGDEFTTRAFEPEFNLIKVTPENWEQELLTEDPDLFFCESAWLGNDGAWQHKVGTGGPRNNTILLDLVAWCKENDIPTAFWNKEDPFHYNAFVNTAKNFDFVFTTDSNSIDKYKEDGCKNVYSFPFAAQPKYHNPIENYERKDKVVFAGAYYGDKFPERKQVMDNMIKISGGYGIDIFDRNYNNPNSPNQFPIEFKNYIVGTLKGDEIDLAYKGYKLLLNVNSIVDSPTMFARRVFEVIASNTPVISSESLGIRNLLGDLVVATNDSRVLEERIDKYFKDDDYYKKNRLLGLRKVLSEHTYALRIKEMLNFMNIDFIEDDQSVSVIGVVRSKEEYDELIKQYSRQKWKHKNLVILLDIFDGYLNIFNANNNEEVKTYLIDYLHNYHSLDNIIKPKYFAVFDKSHYYSENYLTDMILATSYVSDSIIVKGSSDEYAFTTKGNISKSLIGKSLVGLINPGNLLELISNKQNNALDDWFRHGVRFFNIDNFNLISNYQGKKSLSKKIKRNTI